MNCKFLTNLALNYRKKWLSETGSPQSRIDNAEFSEPKILNDYSFQNFEIRRVKK